MGIKTITACVITLYVHSAVASASTFSIFVGQIDGNQICQPTRDLTAAQGPLSGNDVYVVNSLGASTADASAFSSNGSLGVGSQANSVGVDLGFSTQIGACARASFQITDVVLTGEPGTTVTTSFSALWAGSATAGSSTDEAPVGASSNYSVLISANGTTAAPAVVASGSVSSPAGSSSLDLISETLTSGLFDVTVGVPFTVTMSIETSSFSSGRAYFDNNGVLTFGAASTEADFSNTLEFITDGPVFDLPEGYSINSVDGNIVDNIYIGAVPIPAAVWLFGSGLLGLLGISRRKKAAQ